jgi:hypothetical protein
MINQLSLSDGDRTKSKSSKSTAGHKIRASKDVAIRKEMGLKLKRLSILKAKFWHTDGMIK